jgi:hypothetical protein
MQEAAVATMVAAIAAANLHIQVAAGTIYLLS